ncbi:MAG: hypothetical protein ACXVZW_04620 [Gaiellaceae bacterium]
MTTPTTVRRGRRDQYRYQHQVEALLGQINSHVQELRRLKAYGARGPALAEPKQELAHIREQLANIVSRRFAATRVTANRSGGQLVPNR